ncbi:MAG: M23 family metallopeptidase [Actinobacteria bacterium]|nr:M23 family metallopeptidase [Actinomycetota bacterium]
MKWRRVKNNLKWRLQELVRIDPREMLREHWVQQAVAAAVILALIVLLQKATFVPGTARLSAAVQNGLMSQLDLAATVQKVRTSETLRTANLDTVKEWLRRTVPALNRTSGGSEPAGPQPAGDQTPGASTPGTMATSAGPGGELKFDPPVEGKIAVAFGWVKQPGGQTNKLNEGIDIEAPPKSPVKAVLDGVVAKVTEEKNLGRKVMIDHGGGLTTVYAYPVDLTVKEKDRVKKGQVIGSMPGGTGKAVPRLHFEMRVQGGRAVDPETYFGKKRGGT